MPWTRKTQETILRLSQLSKCTKLTGTTAKRTALVSDKATETEIVQQGFDCKTDEPAEFHQYDKGHPC